MKDEDRKALAPSSCSSSSSSVEPSKSIAERRAAKCGFNAQGIKSALFRTTSPLASLAAGARSPRLTIPPGISPAALLDAPIMLPNTQVSFLLIYLSVVVFFFFFSFFPLIFFSVCVCICVYVHIYVSVRKHVLIRICFVV
jgi:hypothetical protein